MEPLTRLRKARDRVCPDLILPTRKSALGVGGWETPPPPSPGDRKCDLQILENLAQDFAETSAHLPREEEGKKKCDLRGRPQQAEAAMAA